MGLMKGKHLAIWAISPQVLYLLSEAKLILLTRATIIK